MTAIINLGGGKIERKRNKKENKEEKIVKIMNLEKKRNEKEMNEDKIRMINLNI